MPEAMEEDDLESTTHEAMALLKDEQARAGGNGIYLGSITSNPTLSNEDLESLRKRLPFLADFSDEFIRSRPMESILKIETTSLKIRQMEQSRDHEDRLASNKNALESSMTSVAEIGLQQDCPGELHDLSACRTRQQMVCSTQRQVPTWGSLLCRQVLVDRQELPGDSRYECSGFI